MPILKAPRRDLSGRPTGGGGGIRAVDAPQQSRKLPPGARIRAGQAPPPRGLPVVKRSPTTTSGVRFRDAVPVANKTAPNVEDSGSASSEESNSSDSVSPIQPTASHHHGREEEHEVDDSLWEIANMSKARKAGQKSRGELDSADSSERHEARKKVGDAFKSRAPKPRPITVSKLPPKPSQRTHGKLPTPPPQSTRPHIPLPQGLRPNRPPPRPGKSNKDDSSESSGESDDDDEYSSYDDDDDSSSSGDGGTGPFGMGKPMYYDPLEEETLKAVRKAKLLARIEQMEAKGVKRTKVFTFRTSEEELMVEVARMEVLAERAIRIEQGRAMLITNIKAIEKGTGFVDRKKWLPLEFNLGGYSKHIIKDMDKFDDCLERGVAETIGPSSSRVWWVELLWILIPSMAYYSMTNSMHKDPEYTNEVLRKNPEFQDRLAREMAKELAHTERQDRERIERELQEARMRLDQQSAPLTNPLPPSARPRSQQSGGGGVAPPNIGTMRPPQRVPTNNPLGDYPVDNTETAKMMAFIAQQQAQNQQKAAQGVNVTETVRNEVRAGLQDVQQTMREEQKRAAMRQRQQDEAAAKRTAVMTQRAADREERRAQPSSRPRPPPAAARNASSEASDAPRQALPPRPSTRQQQSAATLELDSD